MSVRLTILSQIEEISAEQKRNLQPLQDDLVLSESGLDSLCFAILVARLEDLLGYDPFSKAQTAEFPVTLGDFVKFYEDAR